MARHATSVVSTVVFAGALVLLSGSGAPASAQVASAPAPVPAANDAKWEFEVHFGGAFGNQPTAGTPIGTFPVGDAFTTSAGRPSRYASTWYFGDGAALINQIVAGFTGIPVVARVTPLDPVLTRASVERQRGRSLGFRASRRLTPRLGAEFSVDSVAGTLNLSDAALKGIEATRAGFGPTWDGIIATGGGVLFTNGNTSSTSALTNGRDSRQTFLTGAVNFALTRTRFRPYLTAGAGLLIRSGDLPTATLTGTYQFRAFGNAPFNESDVVKVHFAAKDRVPVGLLGGGVKYALSPRQGLRVDLRVHLSTNSMATLVDARPSSVSGSPAFSISSVTTPAIVFSNTSATRSNLTGPAIANLKTFAGSGRDIQTSLTVGYFLRFPVAPVAGAVSAPRAPRAALTGRRWELEAHGGGAFGNRPTSGTPIAAFPQGEAFTTVFGGRPSRYASTWYFGDGAVLINQIGAGFTGTSAVTTKLTALDPVLTAASVERQRGAGVGVRLTRRLTRTMNAEFGIDSMAGSLKMTDTALQGVEATRASFAPMWNALIATGSTIFLSPNVTSTTTLEKKTNSRQTLMTGAMTFDLPSTGRVVPYATAGAGVLLRSGDLPTATLTGNYQFRFLGVSPFNESDVAKVHFAANERAPVGLFGGGFKYALSPRQGLRVDVRVHLSPHAIDTLVDAHPGPVPGTPAFSIASATTPALSFSNTSAPRSNLTGPAITDLTTFAGTGWDAQTNLTIGYFLRF